jgi:hypothetical protein
MFAVHLQEPPGGGMPPLAVITSYVLYAYSAELQLLARQALNTFAILQVGACKGKVLPSHSYFVHHYHHNALKCSEHITEDTCDKLEWRRHISASASARHPNRVQLRDHCRLESTVCDPLMGSIGRCQRRMLFEVNILFCRLCTVNVGRSDASKCVRRSVWSIGSLTLPPSIFI